MCSLVGIYRFTDETCGETDREGILAGLRALERRGPDQSFATVVDERCILGGNRLIIRGDRNRGKMPFSSGGISGCYNGEIYNSEGYAESEADGDALLPAYERHGAKVGSYLDAEFALSIWDATTASLLLARDSFGTRPLFFGFSRERLVWASSPRVVSAILRRGLCTAEEGPAYRHTYAVQEPYTSFQAVWSIPPGHALVVRGRSLTLTPTPGWPLFPSIPTGTVPMALWKTLHSRMTHRGTIAIPMSAGIDSGILAFAAEELGLSYHVFSVTRVFGVETLESRFIEQRLTRLRPARVTLLDCSEEDYAEALRTIYRDSYYGSEYLDNGAILTHCVAAAVHRAGLRVWIDGTGGDELFDGYEFRGDLHSPAGWPRVFPRKSLSSLFTTLLAYTKKVDRAGGYYSFEARYPFQSRALLRASLGRARISRKGPLRQFLLNELPYGGALAPDVSGKYGFSMRGHDVEQVRGDMRRAWLTSMRQPRPAEPPARFPFQVGRATTVYVK